MKKQQTWLGRVWQTDKKMFAAVCVLILGTLWFALQQHEEFPFLLYGMYSLKEEPQQEYKSYHITAAGQTINYTRLWDAEKELIVSTMSKGLAAGQMRDLTPEETQNLRAWLYRYIVDARFVENNTLKVDELTCVYDSTGYPQVKERKTVIDYAAN